MHHQFRSIDLHASSLCPSQLVLQENRETVWSGGLVGVLTYGLHEKLEEASRFKFSELRECEKIQTYET